MDQNYEIHRNTIIWGDEHPLLDMISYFDVHCATRVLTHSHGNQMKLVYVGLVV